MEGKAPLRTLSELAAFFAAKEEKDKPAPPPTPPETMVEEKPAETPPEAKPPEGETPPT